MRGAERVTLACAFSASWIRWFHCRRFSKLIKTRSPILIVSGSASSMSISSISTPAAAHTTPHPPTHTTRQAAAVSGRASWPWPRNERFALPTQGTAGATDGYRASFGDHDRVVLAGASVPAPPPAAVAATAAAVVMVLSWPPPALVHASANARRRCHVSRNASSPGAASACERPAPPPIV